MTTQVSYKGQDARPLFSTDGKLYDLSADSGAASLVHTPSLPTARVFQTKHTSRFPVSYDWTLTLGTLYYGDHPEAIREAARTVANANASNMALVLPFGAYFGKVVPEGFSIATPVDGITSVSAALPGDGDLYFGRTNGRETLGAAYKTLPNKPSDHQYTDIWCIIETPLDQTVTMNIYDASSGASFPLVADAGVYRIQGLPAAPTRFKASAAPNGTVFVTFYYTADFLI